MKSYGIEREWWTQQWLDLLNSYRFKKRLERGRNYAREGNVLSIQFRDQKVVAEVQGTDPEPYHLSIWLDAFTSEDWEHVIETLSEKAIYVAKLLAGEMPDNIESVFAANGLSLFPFTLGEVHSRCSCPDKANPCKHIAAVYYLLGDRFGADPFVLFQLRGKSKDDIISALRDKRGIAPENASNEPAPLTYPQVDLDQFWQYDRELESALVVIAPPANPETVLDVLGPIINERTKITESKQLMAYLSTLYQEVSQNATRSALRGD
ncbi:SWIM zinc finger family protein [Roseofilum capinflatum]|uniref:SWIM zinc finger family protein n=1 Tax=Roseofilum capinflatum BLCC-M114 TaxID=3022440 RepID=A0ABT7B434_9CYAN|nr:SWIM zinc finger family protein [Roseofilum capinflatum]MDJ1173939.1 SWIM zinc finger family protein [Roseofilum capinflatum BLCC-M114]